MKSLFTRSAFTFVFGTLSLASPALLGSGTRQEADLDMAEAIILDNPPDLATWSVTTTITRLEIRPTGVSVEFSKKDGPDRWPDVPFGGGSIQYTLGMCLNIDDQWYCSAPIQFWYGRGEAGGPPSQYAANWFYDPVRWAPMTYHQPDIDETIGFFVVEGNVRGVFDDSQSPLRERSNIVLVPMPDDNGAIYTFGD